MSKVERIGEATLYTGDVLECLRQIPDESVHCIVTSPPYWGLRNYQVDGQLGLERLHDCLGWATGKPCGECYVCHMVAVFGEARRVLRKDGTCWINLGDSYASAPAGNTTWNHGAIFDGRDMSGHHTARKSSTIVGNLKPKDLCMMPARLALALQADGWYLRSDIIWSKPNPMPESCTDRPTKAHEYLFLLSKSPRYFYDQQAIKEPMQDITYWRLTQPGFEQQAGGPKDPLDGNRSERKALNNQHEKLIAQEKWKTRLEGFKEWKKTNTGRNRRTVWTIATQPFPEAHFATFPEKLVEPCTLAGCPAQVCPECGAPWERVIVETSEYTAFRKHRARADFKRLDMAESGVGRVAIESPAGMPEKNRTLGFRPTCICGREDTMPGIMADIFCGAGTALLVALRLGRRAVGIELKPEYMDITRKRIAEEAAQAKLELHT